MLGLDFKFFLPLEIQCPRNIAVGNPTAQEEPRCFKMAEWAYPGAPALISCRMAECAYPQGPTLIFWGGGALRASLMQKILRSEYQTTSFLRMTQKIPPLTPSPCILKNNLLVGIFTWNWYLWVQTKYKERSSRDF